METPHLLFGDGRPTHTAKPIEEEKAKPYRTKKKITKKTH